MAARVRRLEKEDAPAWLELLRASLGEEYPDRRVYDLQWIAEELEGGGETWGCESTENGLQSALTLLPIPGESGTRAVEIARHLIRDESYADGSAQALFLHVNHLIDERDQATVGRVLVSARAAQALYEDRGFVCAGFHPAAHMTRLREGALVYVRERRDQSAKSIIISATLPQVSELARVVSGLLKRPQPEVVQDGLAGYPLQSELRIRAGSLDEFREWRDQCRAANGQFEVLGGSPFGEGYLRVRFDESARAVLAERANQTVAGVAFFVDRTDRCVRIADALSADGLSLGPLLRHVVRQAHEQFNVVLVEVDVPVTAPRLLKSAEGLGLVPVAYQPGLFHRDGEQADVVKCIKLNAIYSPDPIQLTQQAQGVMEIVDRNFQDQKAGVAIINLLRELPIFSGLGDGELGKIARLFTQKLYRTDERVFHRGDSGNEAYVVMRGQIDIVLEEGEQPIATFGNGQIFGEMAFLDGAPRGAMAIPTQPSILLVIQRQAFTELVEREPHLGMVVMRNVAIELSDRLRKTTAAVREARR